MSDRQTSKRSRASAATREASSRTSKGARTARSSGRASKSGRSAKTEATQQTSSRGRSTGSRNKSSRSTRDAKTGTLSSRSAKSRGRQQPAKGRPRSKSDLHALAKRVSGAVEKVEPGKLVTPDEAGLGKTPLPASLFAAAATMLDGLAKGKRPRVLVIDDNDELTTEQAAEMLGVSRPHLIQMLEVERVPHRRVGDSKRGHRRIKREVVLDMKRRHESSLESMDELMRLSEQLAD